MSFCNILTVTNNKIKRGRGGVGPKDDLISVKKYFLFKSNFLLFNKVVLLVERSESRESKDEGREAIQDIITTLQAVKTGTQVLTRVGRQFWQ